MYYYFLFNGIKNKRRGWESRCATGWMFVFFFPFFKKVSVIFHREINQFQRNDIIYDTKRVISLRQNSWWPGERKLERTDIKVQLRRVETLISIAISIGCTDGRDVDRIIAEQWCAFILVRACTDIYVSMYHYAGCALSVDRILKSDTWNREFVEYRALPEICLSW